MKSTSFNPTEDMKKTFNITEGMFKYANNQCLCPFCFGKFTPLTASFRIAEESVCSKMHYDALTPEEKTDALPYKEADDELYEDFWKKFPGSKPVDPDSRRVSRRPVMHMLLNNHLRGQFIPDKDDFPIGMTDGKGNRSEFRVCPRCHNKLPINFGKHPVKYIAIVGITSSGKTVYLSQFLKGLYNNLIDIGFVQVDGEDEAEEFCRLNPVKKGVRLPIGNVSDKLTFPIVITIKKDERAKSEIYTLVFYDIAGENCVNSDKMKRFGPFIVNADGIIMIVDPGQFPGLLETVGEGEDEAIKPSKVLQAMHRAFVAAKSKEGQFEVPFAVAISKSDKLNIYSEYRNYPSNMFQNIDYSKYTKKGFPYNDYLSITTEVERMLKKEREGEAFVTDVNNRFTKTAFFAFSALNVEPVEKKDEVSGNSYYILEEDPEMVRIEEAFNWLLYQLGILEKSEKGKSNGENKKSKKFLGIFGRNR